MLRLHPYRYHRPRMLDEAIGLLAEHAGDVMPIAGGTDLVPSMKHRLFTPGHLVSLRGVGDLRGIDGGDEVVIGAGETLTAVAASPFVRELLPSLAAAASQVAHPMIRNQATIGGNLCLDTRCVYYNQTQFWRGALGFCLKKDGTVCHVVPGGTRCVAAHSADTAPVLMALGAVVDLVSAEGQRTVPLGAFFVADGTANTVRRPGELLVRVRVPRPGPLARAAFLKLRERKAVDFPLLALAAAVDRDAGGGITALSVVVTGLGAAPRRVGGLDALALGRPLDGPLIDEIADRAHRQCHPQTNIGGDPAWRRAMVRVIARRALQSLVVRA